MKEFQTIRKYIKIFFSNLVSEWVDKILINDNDNGTRITNFLYVPITSNSFLRQAVLSTEWHWVVLGIF